MSDIIFTDYPGHVVTLLLVAAVTVLSLYSFRTHTFERLPILRWVLGVLNFVIVLVLIVLTWNPSRIHRTERREQNTLLVCLDTSESMSIKSSSQSRLDEALALFDQNYVNGREDKPRCQWYRFDAKFRPLTRDEAGRQWGSRSDLETALAHLADIVGADQPAKGQNESNLCGVVVFTDGQVNNKQVQSYVKLSRQDCPVVIVGCGHDEAVKDISIRTIQLPVSVRVDQNYNIVAQIVAQERDGQSIDVELRINDVMTDHKTITVSGGDLLQEITFSAYALAPGTDEIKVMVHAVDGELNMSNNVRTRLVKVQADAGMRVLLYSQVASFDIGRIRQSLARDPRIRLDFVFDTFIDPSLKKEHPDQPDRFPESIGEMNQYDLIILGPCRFDQFSDEQIEGLYNFVSKRGGSVIFLPGHEGFGPADCDVEQIRTLIPVRFNEVATVGQAGGVSLTQEGMDQHYTESLCDVNRADDVEVIYTSINKKPAASTVLQCGEQPLVCTQRLGRGKTAMVNSRNLYQLYREDQVDGPLFKLIRDIVSDVGERPSRQSHIEVFVKRSSDAADLIFEACVTDQAYDPAQQATVLLDFDSRLTRMKETWPGTYTTTIPDFEGTSVLARVRAEHRDVYLGEKTVAIELDDIRREMDDIRCDKTFLKSLCEYVGAKYVDVNDLDSEAFAPFEPYHMAQQDPKLERTWPRWPVFVFLVFALVLQWFLRRAKGLI